MLIINKAEISEMLRHVERVRGDRDPKSVPMTEVATALESDGTMDTLPGKMQGVILCLLHATVHEFNEAIKSIIIFNDGQKRAESMQITNADTIAFPRPPVENEGEQTEGEQDKQ